MRKIPTLFQREFDEKHNATILQEVTPGFEWVLNGEGIATVKYDGACCAIIDGELYRRYDAKRGKQPPDGAIPCQPEPDPVTGHWPHWVKCEGGNGADKWFVEAYKNTLMHSHAGPAAPLADGTYEAIGPHFQSNPYQLMRDQLIRHGENVVSVEDRSFYGLKDYLSYNMIEGIVFWRDGEPQCKIKRKDYGLRWPCI